MLELQNADIAREALSECEARYRSLVSSLPEAVLVRGADGRVLFCNELAVELFGAASQADLLGKMEVLAPGIELWDEAGHPVRESSFPSRQVLLTGEPERAPIYALMAAGRRRWIRVAAQALRAVSGHVTGTVTTYTDVTDLLQAGAAQRESEEQIHHASRLESIGRLAGGVAHDFNNLLAAMLGSLDLIEGQVSGEVCQDLATIRQSALRARQLTQQLLAFAGRQPVARRVVDLSVLVRDVETLLRRLVGPRIAIVIQSSGRTLVSADPSLLEQVLVNLAVNARDAMPNGGRLDIHVGAAAPNSGAGTSGDAVAVLSVVDSGTGMDEATRRRIFEPFFTTKAHGTGLGLASSYGIIQQHGGDIRVETEIGRGTRFVVTLPRLADNRETRPKTPQSSAPPAAKGTVLVVDDEDAVRRTTARLVQSLGYQVLDAGSVAQAVERSAGHAGEIDMLLCDIAMPGEDGRNLAAALLQQRTKLKVVFMSGYSPDMQETNIVGALFLQKPFSRDELARKLAELQASA